MGIISGDIRAFTDMIDAAVESERAKMKEELLKLADYWDGTADRAAELSGPYVASTCAARLREELDRLCPDPAEKIETPQSTTET